MTQSQLNRAVARATGEDYDLIDRRGFSLVSDEEQAQPEDDLEHQMIDWEQVQAEQTTALFGDRQMRQAA